MLQDAIICGVLEDCADQDCAQTAKVSSETKNQRYVLIRSWREEEPALSSDSKLAQEQRQLGERIEEIYNAFRSTLDAYLPQLREHLQLLRDVQKNATKKTTERPLLALGVAFLLGMAFGIALSRSRD